MGKDAWAVLYFFARNQVCEGIGKWADRWVAYESPGVLGVV